MDGLDPLVVILVGVTFLLAGCIKGIVGFGLPTVALAMLAATVGLKPAIALTVIPAVLTNVAQAMTGGHLMVLLKRLWPLIVTVVVGVYAGTQVLAAFSPAPLTLFLGVLLVLYAISGLAKFSLPLMGRREVWLTPVFGLVNGTITGLTGTFMMPGILFLQALGLERAALVQAMGLLFMISSLALGVFLARFALLPGDVAAVSFAATLPAFGGMWLGRRISNRLDDGQFRTVLFIALAVVGLFLASRSVVALQSG